MKKACSLILFLAPIVLGQSPEYNQKIVAARNLLKNKDYVTAYRAAIYATLLEPRRWEAYFLAATASIGMDKHQDAIGLYTTSLQYAPEQAKPTINEAIVGCRKIVDAKARISAAQPPTPTIPPTGPFSPSAPPVQSSTQASIAVDVVGTQCKGDLRVEGGRVRFTLSPQSPSTSRAGVYTNAPVVSCTQYEFDLPGNQIWHQDTSDNIFIRISLSTTSGALATFYARNDDEMRDRFNGFKMALHTFHGTTKKQ